MVQQYVPTVRLDDIMRPNGYDVDFLKVDVQGAELLVLQGAAETLESVVVVDVEVHFQPLYVDMPLFADIDRFLRDRGFVFHRISDLTGRGMKPSRLSSSTLWANAVYVKDVDKQYREKLVKLGEEGTQVQVGETSGREEKKAEETERGGPTGGVEQGVSGADSITKFTEDDVFRFASRYNECVATKTEAMECEKSLRASFRRARKPTSGGGRIPSTVSDDTRGAESEREPFQPRPAAEEATKSTTTRPEILRMLQTRKEKLIKQAIILHEIYGAMDVAMHSLAKLGKSSGLATRYYYKMVDSLPTEKYIPGKGTYELTQGFRPPQKALKKRRKTDR